MLRYYVARRIIIAIPLMLFILFVAFTMIKFAPGDPVYMLTGEALVTPEELERLRTELGLNRPFYEQYISYVVRSLRGDLGYSIFSRDPVSRVIAERLPLTLLLMGTQLAIAAVVGIFLAAYSAEREGHWSDTVIVVVSLLCYSTPLFWLAQIAIIIFSLQLNLFPVGGVFSVREGFTGIRAVLDAVWHLVLPVSTLALFHIALIFRLARTSVLEELHQDYIMTAKAKGCNDRRVLYKHALKNALLPVVTIVGMQAGTIIAGTTLVETVFNLPGVGRLMYDSILRRDYPIILGVFVIVSISVVICNTLTDIVYAWINPRIRYH